MINKTIKLKTGSCAEGIYEATVVEPKWLPAKRVEALKRAGIFRSDFKGTVAEYHSLSECEKFAHDFHLAAMVAGTPIEQYNLEQISTTGRRKNLFLDQGLNKLCRSSGTINWSTASTNCAVGTGTTATFTDSGAITATTSGSSTTVTASSSIFTSSHVGQLLRFDSGEERYIASQTGTACVVTVAVNIASPTLFTVWAVNQTGLASESKRSSTYLTGTGNCGSTNVAGVFTYRRTYDFSVEVSNQNYTELGWSDTAAVASNLNARTLISGGSVSVLIGQQLRVIYDLVVTFSPVTSTVGTWSITGWPVLPSTSLAGVYMICNIANSAPSMATTGASTGNGVWPLSRNGNGSMALSTTATLPSPNNNFGAAGSTGQSSLAFASYTDGTFFAECDATWNLTTGNATNWRSIYGELSSAFAFVFNEAQTKTNTHTLTVRTRMTVGRTLTNP